MYRPLEIYERLSWFWGILCFGLEVQGLAGAQKETCWPLLVLYKMNLKTEDNVYNADVWQ